MPEQDQEGTHWVDRQTVNWTARQLSYLVDGWTDTPKATYTCLSEQSEERTGNLRLREGSELSQVTEALGGSPSALPLTLARPLPRP